MQEVTGSQWVLKEYTKDNDYAGSHRVTMGAQRVYSSNNLLTSCIVIVLGILFELPL